MAVVTGHGPVPAADSERLERVPNLPRAVGAPFPLECSPSLLHGSQTQPHIPGGHQSPPSPQNVGRASGLSPLPSLSWPSSRKRRRKRHFPIPCRLQRGSARTGVKEKPECRGGQEGKWRNKGRGTELHLSPVCSHHQTPGILFLTFPCGHFRADWKGTFLGFTTFRLVAEPKKNPQKRWENVA